MSAFISTIKTAVPEYVSDQSDIADYMIRQLGLKDTRERELKILYRASGIRSRYSVLPDFNIGRQPSLFVNGSEPSVAPRMEIYRKNSLSLASEALGKAIDGIRLEAKDLTHLITVSCTGMYAPGLDIDLIEKLGLNTSVQRTSINFMGCYAAFNALKTAQYIVRSNPEAKVGVVCVELCSIHFSEKTDEDSLLSNALFGDGAAAAILTSGGFSDKELEIRDYHSDLALQGKEEMTWNIGDLGFEMKLSGTVPDVIRAGIETLTQQLLDKLAMSIDDIDFFAIHPGGKRILDVIEEKLKLNSEMNSAAREVLRQYGNMSSPTILFVIQSIVEKMTSEDHGKNMLSFAFGPGLTMESMILKTHIR